MKRVLGYTVPWDARAGDTVAVHVSLLGGDTYDLDVVRVVSGDAQGLGLDLRPVASPLDGRYAGVRQAMPLGSCMIVDTPPPIPLGVPFAVEVALWPTLPRRGRQAIVGCWSDVARAGFAVEIDPAGALAFHVGDGTATATVGTGRPLAPRCWVKVRASFDPATGALALGQSGVADPVLGPAAIVARQAESPLRRIVLPDAPLVVAALADPAQGLATTCHYDGKLAAPRLLSDDTILAHWPFAPDGGVRVADVAGSHDGRLVNLPARAVAGPSWTGDVHDWRAARDQYDAIHFHADDLYDARWPVAHRLVVPDWPSGYYAIRLRAGDDTSYLPLFVLPPRGRATAPLAVLASTATSLAYANYHFHLHVDMNEASLGRVAVLGPEDVMLAEEPALGLATYDSHADGSPVRFSSRLRPVLNNGPGGEVWNLNADTHLLAWLDHVGQPFDLITDEALHAQGPALLGRYRAVIAGSHPEYWTTPMWDALGDWLGAGGRLLYLGGNGFYWRAGFSDEWPGAIEVRHAEGGGRYTAETPGEHHMAFTGELGGLWRRSGRPPHALVGVGTRGIGFDGRGRYRRTAASRDPRAAWLFDGIVGETFGADGLLGSAAGSEIDAADRTLGTPPHALIVAASEGHSAAMQPMPEEILMPHPAMSAAHDPRVRAELLFFETASGGAVLSASSLSWLGGVAAQGFDNDVARLTGNALRRFLDPAPFTLPPDT